MLVIIDISEKNLFKNVFHWKWEKLTSNKLEITLFQNLLEMNWNELKLIWSMYLK